MTVLHKLNLKPHGAYAKSKWTKRKKDVDTVSRQTPTGNLTPSITQIKHMPKFMHSYTEYITNVNGDGYCGYIIYCVIALDTGNNENGFEFIKANVINELRLHMQYYLKLYGGGERLTFISEALLPHKRKSRHNVAPMEKWFTFSDMGHIAVTLLDIVIVKLTKHEIGASQTFFPLRRSPPTDPSSQMGCLGLIPCHFVFFKLKDECPIPPTCPLSGGNIVLQKLLHESHNFLDRQTKFDELMKDEIGDRTNTIVGCKVDDPIDL